jgi:hypothetical protein
MLIFRTLFCGGGRFDVRCNPIRLYVILLNMDNSELNRDDSASFSFGHAFAAVTVVAIVVGHALAMTSLVPPPRTFCYPRNVPTISSAGYTLSSGPGSNNALFVKITSQPGAPQQSTQGSAGPVGSSLYVHESCCPGQPAPPPYLCGA